MYQSTVSNMRVARVVYSTEAIEHLAARLSERVSRSRSPSSRLVDHIVAMLREALFVCIEAAQEVSRHASQWDRPNESETARERRQITRM